MAEEKPRTAGDEEAASMMRSMGVELPGEEKQEVGVPWHKVEKKKEMTRAEKEMIFIVKNIADRLHHLSPEAKYEITKGLCGVASFLSLILATVFILKGFSLTVIFASDDPDMNFVIAGAAFGAPSVVWFTYIFIIPYIPCESCKKLNQRQSILEQRAERKKPSLFNEMVAQANGETPIIALLFTPCSQENTRLLPHYEEFRKFSTSEPASQ